MAMIDIHSHFLPFVDDGSPDTESSLTILREAASFGVTDVFLTPHYMNARGYISSAENNRIVFEQFAVDVKNAGIPIKLHLGTEIYYTIDTVNQLRNQTVIPLGDSKFVLIEFNPSEEDEDIAEAVHNMKALGYKAIVAHTERYEYLNKIENYRLMKKMGAYIQINAASVVGKSGSSTQKLVFKLIKEKLVDFVASDMHVFRVNDLAEAYKTIVKKFNLETADHLFNNSILL
jgi:protein-tyrosine phosphatase